jgi:hypothetical protein
VRITFQDACDIKRRRFHEILVFEEVVEGPRFAPHLAL